MTSMAAGGKTHALSISSNRAMFTARVARAAAAPTWRRSKRDGMLASIIISRE